MELKSSLFVHEVWPLSEHWGQQYESVMGKLAHKIILQRCELTVLDVGK